MHRQRALEDLANERMRVLHDVSFIDDPTRLLRLARYASRLGFEIEPHTRTLADTAVRGGALATVSGPRIGTELRLAAVEPDPIAAFEYLGELGLDRAIQPGFGLSDPGLARRAMALLPGDERAERLLPALAGRGMPGGDLEALLDRLAFERADRDVIVAAATRRGLGCPRARRVSVGVRDRRCRRRSSCRGGGTRRRAGPPRAGTRMAHAPSARAA